jgi:hypothetical protein
MAVEAKSMGMATTWWWVLHLLYLQPGKKMLKVPLGAWKKQHHMHHQWTYYTDNILYRSPATGTTFRSFQKTGSRREYL